MIHEAESSKNLYEMNFLRHTSYHNTLKLYHPNWWYSISYTYAPLHSQCDYKHVHLINACSATKQQRSSLKCLRNTYGHVDVIRKLSSKHHSAPVIAHQTGLFNGIKNDLNPYVRLVRFDRPIGKMICSLLLLLFIE